MVNIAKTDRSFRDRQYEELLAEVLAEGEVKSDRTGTGTLSKFGARLEYDMADGFPLITTKFVSMKAVVAELLWFLSGDTNVNSLANQGINIWNAWADGGGDLGPMYGKQFRDWDGIDQISRLIRGLREDPDSRRHIVSSWNVGELDQMALNPCHGLVIQFYVSGSRLDLQMYQRSGDLFLGVPFNIASYSLLLHMVAQQVGMIPGRFIWVCGDTHIYSNHVEQVKEQLSRTVLPFGTLHLRKADDIFSYRPEYVVVDGYAHHPAIRAEVAV